MVAAQRGNADSYGLLLNDIGPMVMNLIRRRVPDAEERHDVYQDVLVAVHRARHTYEPARPLEPWLFTIARHVISDRERRRNVRRSRELLVAEAPSGAAPADAHARVDFEQALRALPRDQRDAMILLHVDGLPLEAAARRAGTTRGALKVRAHRAFKALRLFLLPS